MLIASYERGGSRWNKAASRSKKRKPPELGGCTSEKFSSCSGRRLTPGLKHHPSIFPGWVWGLRPKEVIGDKLVAVRTPFLMGVSSSSPDNTTDSEQQGGVLGISTAVLGYLDDSEPSRFIFLPFASQRSCGACGAQRTVALEIAQQTTVA
ncbi:hypothetical protein LXL04_028686 [Taraxacum kok-saghyz]